ncbi:MAG TPA: zf-HC2 domain-containing protein [Bryobacteraceae bacterium]|nr:zf-HC2 domain-containing protein [Bryobacteraceae bacterium]
MSCENVQELISSLLDAKLAGAERENALAHIKACRRCEAHFEWMQSQREILRTMAAPAVPAPLTTNLRVLASHERERQLARVSFSTRVERWESRIQLAFDNLMRPVALPFTGGLLSTLLLFGLLVPSLSFSHDLSGREFLTVPVGRVVTNPWDEVADADDDFPRIEEPSTSPSDYVNVVDMTIDNTGKVVDWSIVRGELTEDMKSMILFSKFQPATAFGVATWAKIRVVQSCPSATVRG